MKDKYLIEVYGVSMSLSHKCRRPLLGDFEYIISYSCRKYTAVFMVLPYTRSQYARKYDHKYSFLYKFVNTTANIYLLPYLRTYIFSSDHYLHYNDPGWTSRKILKLEHDAKTSLSNIWHFFWIVLQDFFQQIIYWTLRKNQVYK